MRVEVDARARGDEGVREAVVLQQLAAAGVEGREVEVVGGRGAGV